MEDNSHAGQGPVMLDIGGDIGALVLAMPAELVGQEVEARPVDGAALASHLAHQHADHHHLTHVGVVARPTPEGTSYTAVFGELLDGTYEFYLRPQGPVRVTATVRGGEVTSTDWPL
jgi:hypothetical protein